MFRSLTRPRKLVDLVLRKRATFTCYMKSARKVTDRRWPSHRRITFAFYYTLLISFSDNPQPTFYASMWGRHILSKRLTLTLLHFLTTTWLAKQARAHYEHKLLMRWVQLLQMGLVFGRLKLQKRIESWYREVIHCGKPENRYFLRCPKRLFKTSILVRRARLLRDVFVSWNFCYWNNWKVNSFYITFVSLHFIFH